MAFTGTSLLSLPIITTGTESGAWGNITNNGLTQYLDTSIAGALSITSSITLANTSGDASGTNLASTTAQYRTLVVPASGPSANIVITAPSSNRTYHVVNRNATYTVQIRAGANSGVTLGVNQSATVTYNSTSADYELVGVVGASTATDNAVARFDGTTGEIIQNSGVTIDDSANLSTTGTATATKLIPTGNVTAGNGMYLPTTNTLAWSNNGSETMRLDSSGNVGVGTSVPANYGNSNIRNITAFLVDQNLTIGAYYQSGVGQYGFINSGTANNGAAQALVFQGGGTERARIDSSGNLLVGATSALASNTSSFVNSGYSTLTLRNSSSTAGYFWYAGPDSSGNFIIYNNNTTGQYMNYGSTSWSAFSDERIKTNLVPFENPLQKVLSIRARLGRYITDADDVSRSFIIAQDVQKVLPEAVDVHKDDQGTLGLRYTDLIPLLTAAIQEQQALIQSLTARVAALEGTQP